MKEVGEFLNKERKILTAVFIFLAGTTAFCDAKGDYQDIIVNKETDSIWALDTGKYEENEEQAELLFKIMKLKDNILGAVNIIDETKEEEVVYADIIYNQWNSPINNNWLFLSEKFDSKEMYDNLKLGCNLIEEMEKVDRESFGRIEID